MVLGLMPDLDQSGFNFQGVNTYLGPSLGWVRLRIKPERYITVSGAYIAVPDDGVIMVSVAGASTSITLPDVAAWMQEASYNPITSFERAIWIKDLGGNATAFPITVNPFGSQTIDGLGIYTISTNYALARLYPLSNLSGWFVG